MQQYQTVHSYRKYYCCHLIHILNKCSESYPNAHGDTECIFCEIIAFNNINKPQTAAPASTNYALTLIDFNLIKTETFHFKYLFYTQAKLISFAFKKYVHITAIVLFSSFIKLTDVGFSVSNGAFSSFYAGTLFSV